MLSAREITRAVASKEIDINPFNKEQLKEASYTFTLDSHLIKPKRVPFIDTRSKEYDFEEIKIPDYGYLLGPGKFIICLTNEFLKLGDNIACTLAMRGFMAQVGIDALRSETFCEPGSQGGWKGKLMLATSNQGESPIKLFAGINIVKAVFFRLQ